MYRVSRGFSNEVNGWGVNSVARGEVCLLGSVDSKIGGILFLLAIKNND